MFHTYVLAFSGKSIDIDRASFLMDKTLLHQAIKAMDKEKAADPRPDASYGPQWIWDYYCGAHREKYGEGFEPNVNPQWDHDPPSRAPGPMREARATPG